MPSLRKTRELAMTYVTDDPNEQGGSDSTLEMSLLAPLAIVVDSDMSGERA